MPKQDKYSLDWISRFLAHPLSHSIIFHNGFELQRYSAITNTEEDVSKTLQFLFASNEVKDAYLAVPLDLAIARHDSAIESVRIKINDITNKMILDQAKLKELKSELGKLLKRKC